MKAIIIEEDRFAELCDLLKLQATGIPADAYLLKQTNLSKEQAAFAADEIHRRFHMIFVQWAQSHGASCVHR